VGRRSRNRVRAGLQPPKQRRAPAQSDDHARNAPHCHPVGEIERHFLAALAHFDVGEGALARAHLDHLARWWAQGIGRAVDVTPGLVPALLCSYLTEEIRLAWERGWQPADIPRIARRKLSSNHAHLAVEGIAEEAEAYRSRQRTLPSWLDQLAEIGAVVRWDGATDHLARLAQKLGLDREGLLRTGFELVVLVHHLPAIPVLAPPPSEWDRSAALDAAVAWRTKSGGGEVRHLERVRALLAKAESTAFVEEAEALTAKAQSLMTRHSIDAALLAAHAAGKEIDTKPAGLRIGVDDPYAQAKALLLGTIAHTSGCRAVWSKHFGFSTIFGFEGDLTSVELLYTSLLLQARKTMMRAGETGGRTRSRSFRQSFFIGFAIRIGDRLEETANTVLSDVLVKQGNGLLPVLAERSRVVEDHRNEAFPEFEECYLAPSDRFGWVLGRAAAELAEIARGPLLDERATA
jgi:hypothetical protein